MSNEIIVETHWKSLLGNKLYGLIGDNQVVDEKIHASQDLEDALHIARKTIVSGAQVAFIVRRGEIATIRDPLYPFKQT